MLLPLGRVVDFARGAPEWTEELLRRVGESPIDLYLQSSPLKTETFARELQHFCQARVFCSMQWSSSTEGDSILTAYLTQPAPHLKQFTLQFMGLREIPF